MSRKEYSFIKEAMFEGLFLTISYTSGRMMGLTWVSKQFLTYFLFSSIAKQYNLKNINLRIKQIRIKIESSTILIIFAFHGGFPFQGQIYQNSIKSIKYSKLINYMENSERRDPVILHQVPLLPELEAKTLIIAAFPNANLAVDNIQLIKKQGKYQAFLMIPSQLVEVICNRKEITIGKEKVFIRKHFHNFQIFVSKLADSLTAQDVKASLQADFGRILKVEVVQPHQGAKAKWRHCYIHFQKDQDAEKCLFNIKKILVKNEQLRMARAYALGENEQTDKKLFLKVMSPIEDLQYLERSLNDTFRREGKLREKIRVQSGKALVTFTSAEVANRVLLNSKNFKIGKCDILLRPFANKDNYTIFLAGLIGSITQTQLEQALSNYQPLLTCSILPSHNPLTRNGTATFGSQQTFKKILTQYRQDKCLLEIFANAPYITVHMSAKDRSEYNSFKKGKNDIPPKKIINMPLPMGIQMGGMYPPNPIAFGMMMGNQMNIPRQQFN